MSLWPLVLTRPQRTDWVPTAIPECGARVAFSLRYTSGLQRKILHPRTSSKAKPTALVAPIAVRAPSVPVDAAAVGIRWTSAGATALPALPHVDATPTPRPRDAVGKASVLATYLVRARVKARVKVRVWV